MKLDDVYHFFSSPPKTYLNQELAVCYVLSVLLKGTFYRVELIQQIEQSYPSYCLSETILYTALQFLEKEQVITVYFQRVEGRGRPRRVYQLVDHERQRAEELVNLFQSYMERSPSVPE